MPFTEETLFQEEPLRTYTTYPLAPGTACQERRALFPEEVARTVGAAGTAHRFAVHPVPRRPGHRLPGKLNRLVAGAFYAREFRASQAAPASTPP